MCYEYPCCKIFSTEIYYQKSLFNQIKSKIKALSVIYNILLLSGNFYQQAMTYIPPDEKIIETKKCTLTGREFYITDRDIVFYDTISPLIGGKKYSVPTPTLCPDERCRRRTSHRNESKLYNAKSALSGKPIVTLYAPREDLKSVLREEWFSDQWNPLTYAMEFDTNQAFFGQYATMQQPIPRAATVTVGNENSEFTTGTGYCKNCYLINSSEYCERCYYCKLIQSSKDIIDSSYIYDSEILYECFNCEKSFGCYYATNSKNCRDCYFVKNCTGCNNCFMCTNLVNKEYHFKNQPLSKEDYQKKILESKLSDANMVKKVRDFFHNYSSTFPVKYAEVLNSENSMGDFIINSKNCIECYDVSGSENCKYVHVGVDAKDLMDCSNMYIHPSWCLETLGTIEVSNILFCLYVFHSRNLLYCEQCFSCQDCFGCIGLRNQKYCIGNKPYSVAEYEEKVGKLIEHMRQTKEWWEFFPTQLSPFGYNETVAYEYFPLTEKEARARGYSWHDGENKNTYVGPFYTPLPIEQYDEKIVGYEVAQKNIDALLAGIIACEVTKKPFKVIKQELVFYIENHLPLPTKHPDVRHGERMSQRNTRELHANTCSECGIDVMTTYKNRPEKILCENCYRKIVH